MTDDPVNYDPPPFPEFEKVEQPQSSWRPIDTAPKDGTVVFIAGQGSDGWYAADAKWDGEWLLFHPDNDDHTEPSFGVSHWMPIPAFPSVSRPDRTSLLTTPQES